MATFDTVIDINAPPGRVLAVLMDVERWPEWTSTVTSIKRLDAGPFDVGSKAMIKQPKLMPAVWGVTELDKHRNFTWAMRSPGLKVEAGHVVNPRGEGSRVTLSLNFSGFLAPVMSRFYANLNRRYLATEAKGLKERCETQQSCAGTSA